MCFGPQGEHIEEIVKNVGALEHPVEFNKLKLALEQSARSVVEGSEDPSWEVSFNLSICFW